MTRWFIALILFFASAAQAAPAAVSSEDIERFLADKGLLTQLDEALRKALCGHGLVGLRADDRMYPLDRQLWKNVCVYMLCCKYGVAVLEDRLKDEFNPNVALEYGFMRALDKPVLLLADTCRAVVGAARLSGLFGGGWHCHRPRCGA